MSPILVVAAPDSRRRLVDILCQAGYAVAEADSGESAIESVRSIDPELILMSIVMPGISGLEVAAKLRQKKDSDLPPIILLGSITPIGIDEEPLASLVNGYLDIGVSSDDLLAAVRLHLPVGKQPIH